jgi:hypothetical protein
MDTKSCGVLAATGGNRKVGYPAFDLRLRWCRFARYTSSPEIEGLSINLPRASGSGKGNLIKTLLITELIARVETQDPATG